MKANRVKLAKKICWLLFVAICVFHLWSDGKNAKRMMELEQQGQSFDSSYQQIHWLCAPLNISTIVVLSVIAGLIIYKGKVAVNKPAGNEPAA